MEFALSSDQRLMQDSLSRTLQRRCPLDRVRTAAADVHPYATDVWTALCDLGVPGLLVPEAFGGLGHSLLDATLASEALGAAAAPTPFLGHMLATLTLSLSGNEALKAHWMPRLASGKAVGGAALSEAIAGARNDAGVVFEKGRLSGYALFALDGMAADLLIVAAKNGGVFVVPANVAGLSRTALITIDATRRLAELRFDETPAEPLLLPAGAIGLLRSAAWTLIAADTLGAATRMLDMAVSYAKERQQFGRVIGSFQAVKHMCAEMAAELEPCRALVWYAGHVFDAMPAEAPLASAHAKAHLSETGTFIARTATEVHGGMGITDLLGLHYWFKRIGLNRQLLGGPDTVRAVAAALQGFGQ